MSLTPIFRLFYYVIFVCTVSCSEYTSFQIPCLLKARSQFDHVTFNVSNLSKIYSKRFSCVAESYQTEAVCTVRCSISDIRLTHLALNESVYEKKSLQLVFVSNDSSHSSSVRLTLKCSSNAPQPVILPSEKSLYISLDSEVACPLWRTPIDDLCIFTDPLSNHKFDLRPLRQKGPFKCVNKNNKVVLVNVCGDISEVFNATHQKLIGSKNDVMKDGLSLKYGQVKDEASRPIAKDVAVEFVSTHDVKETVNIISHHRFQFLTSKVRRTPLMECFLSSAGFQFDLSILRKQDSNWVVPTDNGLIFLNLCGPLILNADTSHCNGSTNVCFENGNSFQLSSLKIKDRSHVDGIFGTRYKLKLSCGESVGTPTFVDNSIDWVTSAACSYQVGTNCSIFAFSKYKLQPLFQKIGYRAIKGLNELSVNFCGPLSTPCNGNNETAVCLTRNGSATVIGYNPANLIFKNGVVQFVYGGEACYPGGPMSKVIVTLICDHLATFSSFYELSVHSLEESTCTFNLELRTNLVCKPVKRSDSCSSADLMVDLSPLTLYSGNRYLEIPNEKSKFFFNICRSLNPDHMMCPWSKFASICLYNETNLDTSQENGGQKVADTEGQKLKYINGSLELHFIGNRDFTCNDEVYFGSNATIKFKCDPNSEATNISLLSKKDCNYEFLWETKHACPQKQMKNIRRVANYNFVYEESVTSTFMDQFSLLPLGNRETEFEPPSVPGQNMSVTLSLLEPLTECGEKCGVCLKSTGGTNCGGKLNNKLRQRSGSVFLLYENGTKLATSDTDMGYTTTIIFECGLTEGEINVKEIVLGFSVILIYKAQAFCSKEITPEVPLSQVSIPRPLVQVTVAEGSKTSTASLPETKSQSTRLSSTAYEIVSSLDFPATSNESPKVITDRASKYCNIDKSLWLGLNITQVDARKQKACGLLEFCPSKYSSGTNMPLDYSSFTQCNLLKDAEISAASYCKSGRDFAINIFHPCSSEPNNLLKDFLESVMKNDGCHLNVTAEVCSQSSRIESQTEVSEVPILICIIAVAVLVVVLAAAFLFRNRTIQKFCLCRRSSENVLYSSEAESINIMLGQSNNYESSSVDEVDDYRRRKNS